MRRPTSIAIIGGGLGGLATARALNGAGFDVHVFEQAAALGEVGAGINISPQATKALAAMGLGDAMARIGNVVSGQWMRFLETGEVFIDTGLGTEGAAARFGAPYYAFHRADLLDLLAASVPSDRVHLGHRCVGLEEGPDCVTVRFANGVSHRADILIAADGIHSMVRRALYGADEPRFTHQVVWRAFVDGHGYPEDILGPYGFSGWMGKGRHLMTYYLRGRTIINITAQVDADDWVEEGWSIKGDPEEMRRIYSPAAPPLQSILNGITSCSKWGLFGRRPTRQWGRGRIQLIGDAAHPMLPNAGQGASQAFEDAYVLARWLAAYPDDPEAALAGFRNVRIPRAHAVQRQSLVNGRLAHSGELTKHRDTFDAREKEGDTGMGLSWIYGYEPQSEWSDAKEYALSNATDMDDTA